ncbi:MAG: tetratricopeptide repeat protein [Deltaproteobacteria bacterium]|nr:tetratricopeptide repeat protein [Deltaproteobacteria bacterium]
MKPPAEAPKAEPDTPLQSLGQESAVSNEMRAEYLFRTGEKKFDAGKYAEACADFAESLRLGPKLGTLLNLALCHETVGRFATAWGEFNHASVWALQNNQKDRHEFAQQHIAGLEGRLPRVLLSLPRGQAFASVEVDGEPLADSRWYLPIFLDAGEHSVSVSAPGKERSTVKFRVINSPTEQLVSIPSLVDEKPRPPPPPPVVVDRDATRRTIGYVTLATGGALLVTGVAFGISALDSRATASDNCFGNRCNQEGFDAYRSSQSKATVSTVTTLIGLGAVGVGAWLVLTSRRPEVRPRVGVGPRGDGGWELGVGGAF